MGVKQILGLDKEEKLMEEARKQNSQQHNMSMRSATLQHYQMVRAMDEDNDSTLINVTLDNTPLLQQLEMSLRGLVIAIDENGNPCVQRIGKPVMNDEGIQSVLQTAILGMGKNTILSYISDGDLRKIMMKKHQTLVLMLAANSVKFGLDKTKRDSVVWDISNTIFFSMSRSVAGTERIEAYRNTKKIEHQSIDEKGVNKNVIFGGG